MKKNLSSVFSIALGITCVGSLLISSQLSFGSPEEPPSKVSPQWTQKMQNLYRSLADILADISSNERFNSPKNKIQIETHAKKLASLAHDLNNKDMKAPDQDPTIKILSGLFSDEAQHA